MTVRRVAGCRVAGLRPAHAPRAASERGSVTIVTAGVLVLALMLSLAAADLARVLAASAHAQTAADASALAAAQELALPGGVAAADVAAEYASRNDAVLVDCTCPPGGFEATVAVRRSVGALLLFDDDRTVEAWARAVVDLPTA